MAPFGGSQPGSASQIQAPSPFSTNMASSDSRSSTFSPNPFGGATTSSDTQGKNGGTFGSAFGAPSSTTATQSNPFIAAASANSGNFKNPFGPTSSGQTASVFSQNTKPQGLSTFGQPSRSPSPFSAPSNHQGGVSALTANGQPNPFGAPSTNKQNLQHGGFGALGGFGTTSEGEESHGSDGAGDSKWAKRKKRQPESGNKSDSEPKRGGILRTNKTASAPNGGTSKPNHFEQKRAAFTNGSSTDGRGRKVHFEKTNGASPNLNAFGSKAPASSTFGSNATPTTESINTDDPFGKKIFDQLQKANLRPPKWPADPGHPHNKNAMDSFKAEYKAYRVKARACLIRAGLIDDPEQRRRLEDALDFKGICDDMCPDFEKLTRITEFDVQQAEKDPGVQRVDTARMVKKLARSAAGQEAPLPMDVRSIRCLKRTLNYLLDDLLQSDDNLSVMHGFLWDRTRAIRRDFAFFSSMTPEELKGQVYCFETIARFHVTSLHLLSRRGFAPEDFSEQQEIEQLGKTLISLMYAYNDCNGQGIKSENETEFRAYQLVFRANQPDVLDTLQQEWDPEFFESDIMRTAVSLVEALQNTSDFHGPLRTGPSHSASGAYNTYFRIVEDPSVSYTMACFAEIHFGQLRRSILAALQRGFSRPKMTPKDITPEVLNTYLRFDTVEEAIDFVENHGLRFEPHDEEPDNPSRQYLFLEQRQSLEWPRLHHTFSQRMVERKRGSHSLPELIHNNVFESPSAAPSAEEDEDSLFLPTSGSTREPEHKPTFTANNTTTTQASPFPGGSGRPSSPKAPAIVEPPKHSSPFAQPSPFTQAVPPATTPAATTPAFKFPSSSTGPAKTPFGGLNAPAAPQSTPSFTPPTSTSQQPFPPASQAQRPTFSFTKPDEKQDTSAPAPAPSVFATPTTSKVGPTPGSSSNPFGFLKPNAIPSTASTGPPTQQKPAFPPLPPGSDATSSPTIKVTPPTPGFPTNAGTPAQETAKPPPQPSPFPRPTAESGVSVAEPTPSVSVQPVQQLPPSKTTPRETNKPTSSAPPKPASSVLDASSSKDALWAGFTKWIVKGDNGITDHFERFIVQELVTQTYNKFKQDEAERIRTEEDERSWTEALKFRTYSLQVKFFYRWRKIAHESRARALRTSGRDQVRQWREAKLAEKRELKLKEERLKKRLADKASRYENVEGFKEHLKQRRLSLQETEDALLASGVLSGVSNEREAAARIVRSHRTSPEEERPAMPGFMHKIKSGISQSVARIKPGGAKTQALREEFLNGGSSLRNSLRSTSRGSRFSTPSMSESGLGRSRSRTTMSSRWQLKAMGLETMPDGSVLPDYLAYPILQGKRLDGLGTHGVERTMEPPSRSVSAADLNALRPATADTEGLGFSRGHKSTASLPAINGGDLGHKRKRSLDDSPTADGDDTVSPSSSKRIYLDSRKTIEEMRKLREDMAEGTHWFREQNEKLQNEVSASRGGTPWK